MAVGEAGEKHQEARDGAAWLSVSKESWQDQKKPATKTGEELVAGAAGENNR